MKVTSKVALGAGSLLLVFAGVTLYQLILLRGLLDAQRELSTAKTRAAKAALDQLPLLEEIDESIRKLYVTQDVQYGAKIDRLRRAYAGHLDTIAALGLSGGERTAFERLEAAWHALPPTPPATTEATAFVAPLERLQDETEGFLAAVEEAIENQVRDSVVAGEAAGRLALAAVVSALVLGALAVRLTVRSINEPLRRLTEGTRQVAEGRFDLELDTSRGDEFSHLAADFNVMVQRLGELDAMKKDLLSHVSHELKTPLATLQETQQVLLEELPGPLNDAQRRLLELNLKSSARLSRLISKLLDLSRLEAGAMAYDFARRDLVPLVRDAVEELEPRARERRIRVESELPDKPLELDCDGDRLIQVLENLLENAIKFSPEDSAVRLEARAVPVPPENLPEGRLPSALYGRDGAHAILVRLSDSGPRCARLREEADLREIPPGGAAQRRLGGRGGPGARHLQRHHRGSPGGTLGHRPARRRQPLPSTASGRAARSCMIAGLCDIYASSSPLYRRPRRGDSL